MPLGVSPLVLGISLGVGQRGTRGLTSPAPKDGEGWPRSESYRNELTLEKCRLHGLFQKNSCRWQVLPKSDGIDTEENGIRGRLAKNDRKQPVEQPPHRACPGGIRALHYSLSHGFGSSAKTREPPGQARWGFSTCLQSRQHRGGAAVQASRLIHFDSEPPLLFEAKSCDSRQLFCCAEARWSSA